MNGEYGNDFITITDDEGNDFSLEHLDTIELDNTFYMAFLPADADEDDEDYGLIVLKVIEENGEDVLTTIDDEEKLEEVFERFMERLLDDDEP